MPDGAGMFLHQNPAYERSNSDQISGFAQWRGVFAVEIDSNIICFHNFELLS